ncbi:DNA polymerase alpha catalytic subunit, partial [Aspergillus arachidicola]
AVEVIKPGWVRENNKHGLVNIGRERADDGWDLVVPTMTLGIRPPSEPRDPFSNELQHSFSFHLLQLSTSAVYESPDSRTLGFAGWNLSQSLEVNEDSGSSAAFNRARQWLSHCVQHDQACKPPDTEFMPRRLVNVGSWEGSREPFLFEPTTPVPYACLSYCWGIDIDRVMKTTTDNIHSHYQRLELATLPAAIQDAIVVCRALKISNLWVDSLCIIQDDKVAWLHDASTMHDVYRNSHLTIAVMEPNSCKLRFLGKQQFGDPSWQRLFCPTLPDLPEDTSTELLMRPGEFKPRSNTERSSLDKRGWCLQESLLPNRRLCYDGKEMIWECLCRQVCECGHVVEPQIPYDTSKDYGKLGTTLKTHLPEAEPPFDRMNGFLFRHCSPPMILYFGWRDLVTDYSHRSLSKRYDALRAISALAKMVQFGYPRKTDRLTRILYCGAMASARAKLAELRALRASGKKRISTYEVEEQDDIYEEVDDEGYKKIIRNRLDEDDFVVDDNGEGYADDGREDWTVDYHDSESDDGDLPANGKAAKRKREEDKQRKEKINNGISKYFNKGSGASAPKPKPVATAEDEAFMADLLGEVDTNVVSNHVPTQNVIKSETRRKVRVLSPPLSHRPRPQKKQTKDENSDPMSPIGQKPDLDIDNDDGPLPVADDDDVPMSDPMPSSPVSKAVERKTAITVKTEDPDEEDNDLMEIAEVTGQHEAKTTSVNMAGSRPPPKIKKEAYSTPANSSPVKAMPDPSIGIADVGKLRAQDVVEDDGSLRMFWIDFTEVNGSLCLFGKVKNKQTGNYASAFVKVDNILRKLYFLPREYRHKHGRDTDEEVDMEDVYNEVDGMMSRLKVGMHKIKPCTRKYAFEMPGVPKETEYLKLLYPYDKPALPMETKGETFSHVFGTNTSLFEQFVLWKNIMGPCWLRFEGADFSAVNNASWCKFECQVSKPALISPVPDSENLEAPPLTLMSLAFRTQLNVKENKQEILIASARVYENVSLTDTTPPEKVPCKTFTVMRPVGSSYPMHFEAETKRQRGTYILERSEQFLLSKFLALFEKMDPDVLMGHQLQEVDLSILLNRLKEKKTPGWHRLGRLKRGDWPKNFNRGGGFFAERHLIAGRLMCDVANDMGKSLMMKCQSWSLTEMCNLYLGPGNVRQELDSEAALKTWATTKDGLMNFVNHCDTDTYFVAALVLRLQMLPLTKVLTNIAGNSWARTLSGTRAERNEYILLHEFHRNKYICPDKYSAKLQKAEVKLQDGDDDDATDKKKKDKYKGGLVFEPEKGLYDRFVLVMDFNSLYPSIIQEYNICFTTVERTATAENENEEKVPEVPSSDQEQGILPRLIATLVGRRREVKKLMKDKRATPEQLALWDTKQLAFKLTANSMYGCLGYTQSRFYARPLAMLTTFKGREILRSTKELAESKQLRVIYGDTDSVMINTNMDTLSDALKVGEEFKKSVNERYRLLEIDIDNIFRRLLLHAKKKYAAINMTEMDGKYVDKLEVKGLDMKRREYCALSKEVSQRLLNEVLSGEDQEIVLNRVHDYLRDLAGKMREFAVPVQKYVIYTKLSKRPEEYPNKETMPPVQVALRELARGKSVRPNDVISYIVTSGDSETSSLAPAKRSYTLQDVMKPDSGLNPDIEFYLLKQIFPPIERLCAPIPGTDAVRLAECLGLDVRKYQINTSSGGNQQNTDIFPLESQIPDSVRFESAARLTLTCRSCKEKSVFEGLAASAHMCNANGLFCPNTACQKQFTVLTIIAQLESQIRAQTSKYYEGWLVCDDSACGNRTRQMSVYGHRCLGPRGHAEGCLGRMSYEYSEKQLYNQLLYFAGLWDVDKARVAAEKEASGEKKDSVVALASFNRARFETVKGVVDAYLKKCGRQWVEMDSLFRFMLP